MRSKEAPPSSLARNPNAKPAQFDPINLPSVRDCALLGYSNGDIANYLQVSIHTFERWAHDNEDLKSALDEGRMKADGQVVNALLKRALGYEQPTERIINCNGIPTRMMTFTHYPADVTAALAWLQAKVPQVWQEQTVNTNINVDATPKAFALPPNMSHEQKRSALEAVELLLKLQDAQGDEQTPVIDITPGQMVRRG